MKAARSLQKLIISDMEVTEILIIVAAEQKNQKKIIGLISSETDSVGCARGGYGCFLPERIDKADRYRI